MTMSYDYERTVWTADGLEWRWNRATSLWECRCEVCDAEPQMREALSLGDLESEHGTVSDWRPREYGKHSHTRGLDEPAVSATELITRETPMWPLAEVA